MPFPILLHRLLPFGRRSEIAAAGYLRSLGYRVVRTNFLTRGGEIDIVAWDGDILVFVEVRSRRSARPPEESIHRAKQRRVIRAAAAYRSRYGHQDTPCRFDVVTVNHLPGGSPTFHLYRDAFGSEPA